MRRPRRRFTAALAAATTMLVMSAVLPDAAGSDDHLAPASAHGVEVIATGLNGPREIQVAPWGAFYVVEADINQITQVEPWNGDTNAIYTGLPAPQGVALTHRGDAWIVTGGPPPPSEGEGGPPPPPSSPYPSASLLHAERWTGHIHAVADLEAYELANNPDGQRQFGDDGVPLDALANPFYVVTRPGGAIVADGGANAVFSISAGGAVTTLFVPPVVTTGACAGRPNNDPASTGCDSVPTGLAWGPDGALYVSTLSGEAPGQGLVYKINPYSGQVLATLGGFNAPLGVAVGDDGTVYVSEGLYGLDPEGPPPANPADIGRIVRVSPGGARAYAPVPMTTGLLYDDGELYASAWSLAAFLGMEDAGQVVRVHPHAFRAAPAT